jgi:hypothetical protein
MSHKCRSAKFSGLRRRDPHERVLALDQPGDLEGFEGFGDGDRAADLVDELSYSPAAVAVLEQEVEDEPFGLSDLAATAWLGHDGYEEFESLDSFQRLRYAVPPGITGLWQIARRKDTSLDEMTKLDIIYCRTWTPLLDLTILMRTPAALTAAPADTWVAPRPDAAAGAVGTD